MQLAKLLQRRSPSSANGNKRRRVTVAHLTLRFENSQAMSWLSIACTCLESADRWVSAACVWPSWFSRHAAHLHSSLARYNPRGSLPLQEAKGRKGVCNNFLNGRCRLADSCRFSHDLEGFLLSKGPDLPGRCPFSALESCPYGARSVPLPCASLYAGLRFTLHWHTCSACSIPWRMPSSCPVVAHACIGAAMCATGLLLEAAGVRVLLAKWGGCRQELKPCTSENTPCTPCFVLHSRCQLT